jgi:hypothetical protein
MWLSARLGACARRKADAAGGHWSSFTPLNFSVLRPGWKKAARNAPKCHHSRLNRAGVFVPVVAQPIQDMSAVSIAHKTVGIRLPRLRCGAIGLVCFRPADHPKRVSSSFFSLYMVGVGGWA